MPNCFSSYLTSNWCLLEIEVIDIYNFNSASVNLLMSDYNSIQLEVLEDR